MADASVNEKIHDSLIAHDVDLRRIAGDCTKRAERRLDRLTRDLSDLARRIDPHGASRKDARERRVARLEKESAELVREAYRDLNAQSGDDLKRVARIESEVTVATLEKHIP